MYLWDIIGRFIHFLSGFLCLICFVVFSFLAYEKSRYPYNELGRYFDGQIVWKVEGVLVFQVLACVFFVLSSIIFLYYFKIIKNKQ